MRFPTTNGHEMSVTLFTVAVFPRREILKFRNAG
jgi:hypothetical protein